MILRLNPAFRRYICDHGRRRIVALFCSTLSLPSACTLSISLPHSLRPCYSVFSADVSTDMLVQVSPVGVTMPLELAPMLAYAALEEES